MERAEAIALFESRWWENATKAEIFERQLHEDRLIVEFSIFHEAAEKALGRAVFTHEFADRQALIDEYEGRREYDGLLPSIRRVAPNAKVIGLNPETGKAWEPDD